MTGSAKPAKILLFIKLLLLVIPNN